MRNKNTRIVHANGLGGALGIKKRMRSTRIINPENEALISKSGRYVGQRKTIAQLIAKLLVNARLNKVVAERNIVCKTIAEYYSKKFKMKATVDTVREVYRDMKKDGIIVEGKLS